MLEILFRGKQITDKVWFDGGIYTRPDGKTYIVRKARYRSGTQDWDVSKLYENDSHYTTACIEVIPETIGQFTGMTDKNGQKIYEGDVIIYNDSYKYRVFWSENEHAFYINGVNHLDLDRLGNLYGGLCEVIGNIHDNPELLED